MAGVVAFVLAALALSHVYWGVAGVAPRSVAIPEIGGKPAFAPSRVACFAVAMGLALAGLLVLLQRGVLSSPVPPAIVRVGTLGVAAAFLLGAVGDFRLVGFFKRVRGSRFAAWDTRLYSPLSLAIGLASLWVAIS